MGAGENDNLTKATLLLLAGGAILTAAVFFPGLGLAYKQFKRWQKFDKRKLKQTLHRLHKQKIVKVVEKNNQLVVELTDKGKSKAAKYQLDNLQLKKPAKWDKLWRIVIFDIPEKKKAAREVLREKLKRMGFYQLQKSIFVHPYPCKTEIDLLKSSYEIEPNVALITAKTFDGQSKLSQHFFGS